MCQLKWKPNSQSSFDGFDANGNRHYDQNIKCQFAIHIVIKRLDLVWRNSLRQPRGPRRAGMCKFVFTWLVFHNLHITCPPSPPPPFNWLAVRGNKLLLSSSCFFFVFLICWCFILDCLCLEPLNLHINRYSINCVSSAIWNCVQFSEVWTQLQYNTIYWNTMIIRGKWREISTNILCC